MKRSITSIREKLYADYVNRNFINGLQVGFEFAGDYGDLHSTTSYIASFPGFSVEFTQNEWLPESSDELCVVVTITELEGFSYEKLKAEAMAMVNYLKSTYLASELKNAVILEPTLALDLVLNEI